MKYLALLVLLMGCAETKPLYKVGDCIRVTTNNNQGDFYIREVTGTKYVVSLAFKVKGVPSYQTSKGVVSIDAMQNIVESRKINCSEVE